MARAADSSMGKLGSKRLSPSVPSHRDEAIGADTAPPMRPGEPKPREGEKRMTEATKPTALFRVEDDGGRSSQVSMRRRAPPSSASWTPPMVTSPT